MTAPTLEAERAAPELLPCPECDNTYLAIRTDIYKDKRQFVYCDCCGCIAVRSIWNSIARRAAPVAEGVELPKQSIDTPEFADLMAAWSGAAHSCDKWTRTDGAKQAWRALIAYIDGRTA